MNNKEPKDTTNEESNSSNSYWMSMYVKYKAHAWNIMLFFIGLYLIWTTISVLLSIIGCLIGMFLIAFAISEMGYFEINTAFEWIVKKLRRK
jgi:uncharacterized membrane protein